MNMRRTNLPPWAPQNFGKEDALLLHVIQIGWRLVSVNGIMAPLILGISL
jgi:hypothetical protein